MWPKGQSVNLEAILLKSSFSLIDAANSVMNGMNGWISDWIRVLWIQWTNLIANKCGFIWKRQVSNGWGACVASKLFWLIAVQYEKWCNCVQSKYSTRNCFWISADVVSLIFLLLSKTMTMIEWGLHAVICLWKSCTDARNGWKKNQHRMPMRYFKHEKCHSNGWKSNWADSVSTRIELLSLIEALTFDSCAVTSPAHPIESRMSHKFQNKSTNLYMQWSFAVLECRKQFRFSAQLARIAHQPHNTLPRLHVQRLELKIHTNSSSFKVARGTADVKPALRFVAAIV